MKKREFLQTTHITNFIGGLIIMTKKIHYLGPKDTYTEQATKMVAEKIEEKPELLEKSSLEAVAKGVASDKGAIGVMAYYNYLEGLIQECLDLIYENNLRIVGLQRLPIVFSLGMHKQNQNMKEIYSHPKALAQCSDWLWQNYAGSKQVATPSTAAAAKIVAEIQSGFAIANTQALKRSGLEIIAENIGNRKGGRTNSTDFYIVSSEENQEYDPAKQYLSMIAITPHMDKPGLLAEILGQVAYHNLNNAKIHSRPAISKVIIPGTEPQMFYLEITAHQKSEDMVRCIDSLKYKMTPKGRDVEVVRVLGSYEKP